MLHNQFKELYNNTKKRVEIITPQLLKICCKSPQPNDSQCASKSEDFDDEPYSMVGNTVFHSYYSSIISHSIEGVRKLMETFPPNAVVNEVLSLKLGQVPI